MSDERRAEIEAVARALHEQGFGFDIDADPVARESMFSVARVVLDRLRDAQGDDEAARCGCNELLGGHRDECPKWGDPPAARSPQGEDHEALQRAVRAFVESWWEFDSLPPQDHYNAVAERVQVLDDILSRVSAPKADENQEASQTNERRP
jgi:hypothetical protein